MHILSGLTAMTATAAGLAIGLGAGTALAVAAHTALALRAKS